MFFESVGSPARFHPYLKTLTCLHPPECQTSGSETSAERAVKTRKRQEGCKSHQIEYDRAELWILETDRSERSNIQRKNVQRDGFKRYCKNKVFA